MGIAKIKSSRWSHIQNQLPVLGQRVEIRLSEEVSELAYFTGVSFNPGRWCYGIFKKDILDEDTKDFNTAVEWRAVSNISEPVGRSAA